MLRPKSNKPDETLFFLSPRGSDHWSGRRPTPNRGRTDGPWATPAGALRRLAEWKAQGRLSGPVALVVGDGVYELAEPLRISPSLNWPIRFCAAPGARPVFSGGRRIRKWRVSRLNGRPVWIADLPEVREGQWTFRSLYVNGTRAPRPRRPRRGLFRWRLFRA